MYVTELKTGDTVTIGDGVRVIVTEVHAGRVRLGIEAPLAVPIMRGKYTPPSDDRPATEPGTKH
jgi:carbon storage regulator CsrA